MFGIYKRLHSPQISYKYEFITSKINKTSNGDYRLYLKCSSASEVHGSNRCQLPIGLNEKYRGFPQNLWYHFYSMSN